MHKIRITLLFLVLSYFSFAQNQKISGVVLDQTTNKPVANVSVKTSENMVTTTNSFGKFTIEVKNFAKLNLTVSYVGYKTEIIKNFVNNTTVFLNAEVNSIEEVNRIIEVFESIGIKVNICSIEEPTFLPGIMIEKGELLDR